LPRDLGYWGAGGKPCWGNHKGVKTKPSLYIGIANWWRCTIEGDNFEAERKKGVEKTPHIRRAGCKNGEVGKGPGSCDAFGKKRTQTCEMKNPISMKLEQV